MLQWLMNKTWIQLWTALTASDRESASRCDTVTADSSTEKETEITQRARLNTGDKESQAPCVLLHLFQQCLWYREQLYSIDLECCWSFFFFFFLDIFIFFYDQNTLKVGGGRKKTTRLLLDLLKDMQNSCYQCFLTIIGALSWVAELTENEIYC